MQKLIYLVFILPLALFAQNDSTGLPTVEGKIKFVDIVEVPGVNKNSLFVKAQSWVTQNLKSEQNKIIINDPINSVISGEHTNGTKKNPDLKFTYTITCKDDKYRIEVENLYGFLDLSSMTKQPGSWVPVQRGYDLYLKQKEKGKNIKVYENSYSKVREEINNTIILPLKKSLTSKSSDF